jgi:hypothetical protein
MRIFIGYEPDETVALNVLAFSIWRRASVPVSITPLMLRQLPLTRKREPMQSTEFSFSRFLVPHLCGYEGEAAFLDCDMLCRVDIAGLFQEHIGHGVSVVQHNYTPKHATKFLDKQQTAYKRKNWSSLMRFDCAKCRALTPEYVNTASGLDLHQFAWLHSAQIGALDPAWNHLVGEYDPNPSAKIAHFTLGTPCFAKYRNCEFAQEWRDELSAMLYHNALGEYSLPDRMTA